MTTTEALRVECEHRNLAETETPDGIWFMCEDCGVLADSLSFGPNGFFSFNVF